VASNNALRSMGVFNPPGKKEIWGSNLQPKHAAANCRCHLTNTTPIPHFTELLSSLYSSDSTGTLDPDCHLNLTDQAQIPFATIRSKPVVQHAVQQATTRSR